MAKGVENNAKGKAAKIALRRRALTWLTPAAAQVFEAYAGSGMMWREAGVVGLVAPVAAGEAAGVAGAGVAGGVMAEPVENACSAA